MALNGRLLSLLVMSRSVILGIRDEISRKH
jgi:hypothetical protein